MPKLVSVGYITYFSAGASLVRAGRRIFRCLISVLIDIFTQMFHAGHQLFTMLALTVTAFGMKTFGA